MATAACEDGPTAPGVYTHASDGRLWAAVKPPASLPTLRTWLPYVRAGGSDADSAVREVRGLQARADRLRRAGDREGAVALETEASLVAAAAANPPPYVLSMALGGLARWSETAGGAASETGLDEVRAAAGEVDRHRAAAAEALERGDTAAAVGEIVRASAVAQSLAPAAVASRALTQAERTLAARPTRSADAARALRLVRNAREALASGDDERALRRAFYSLQIAEAVARTADAGGAAR